VMIDGRLPLHLKTQRGQPYGSVRQCCERCGLMLDANGAWTADEAVYSDPPDPFVRCDEPPVEPAS
jgi:hypothetical protein